MSPASLPEIPARRDRICYHPRMENWLQIPEKRKRLPVFRLCLIMALTVLILLLAGPRVYAALIEAPGVLPT